MVIALLRVGMCSCASNHMVWDSAACAAEWMDLVPLLLGTRLRRQGGAGRAGEDEPTVPVCRLSTFGSLTSPALFMTGDSQLVP